MPTHPHARQNVVGGLIISYEILLQHSLITKGGDFVLEEVDIVLVVVFVAEMFLEAVDAGQIFDCPGLCGLERLLLIQCVPMMVLPQLCWRRSQSPECKIMVDNVIMQV